MNTNILEVVIVLKVDIGVDDSSLAKYDFHVLNKYCKQKCDKLPGHSTAFRKISYITVFYIYFYMISNYF